MYIVNAPSSVYLPWQMVKKFLQEATVKKIQFCKQQVPDPLFQHTHRDQIEKKYGGTAPDLVKFWPPQVPSENYLLNQEETKYLTSKEEYVTLYQKNQLMGHKINMPIISEYTQPSQDNKDNKANELKASTTPTPGGATKDSSKYGSGQNSLDNIAIKSRRQSMEVLPNLEIIKKEEEEAISLPKEKICLNPLFDDCEYTSNMDEINNFSLKILIVRQFQAYFFNKEEM